MLHATHYSRVNRGADEGPPDQDPVVTSPISRPPTDKNVINRKREGHKLSYSRAAVFVPGVA